MLINDIKEMSLTARKNGNKVAANLLVTLYAEAAMVGKNKGNRDSTDEEVIAVVRKFIKNNEETLKVTGASDVKLYEEQSILHNLLPKQLSDDEITHCIKIATAGMGLSMKSMKAIKQYIDANYPGAYDGARVSSLLNGMM